MAMDSSQTAALAASQRAAARQVRQRASIVVRKTGMDIARDGKLIAHQKFSDQATGATANSISSTMVNELAADIGPTTYYALFVEQGTSRMQAKPFMAPAAERNEEAFNQAMAQVGEEGTGV